MRARERILLLLEVLFVAALAFSLWFKILLPGFYYVVVALLTALVVLQVALDRTSKFIIVQIAIIFLLTRSIYNLSMNYSIIPFGDGNFDYATAATFMQKGSVFIIDAPPLLEMYSGWPLLHVLAISLSSVSGLDLLYVSLLLPSIIGISLFLFVYLIIERIRKSLGFDASLTFLALLIFAASPDSIFWPMQFVRQNIGLLFLTITVFLIVQAVSKPTNSEYKVLAFFFALALVMAHHLTSLILVVYLFLLCILIVLGRYSAKTKIGIGSLPRPIGSFLLSMALGMAAFLFVWWDRFATAIWPYVTSSIERVVKLLEGIKTIEVSPTKAIYPALLTPGLVPQLLLFRDVLLYLPAVVGFFLISRRATKAPEKTFLVYSALAFGTIFIVDYFITKIGYVRIIGMFLPILVFLSATTYFTIIEKINRFWKVSARALVPLIALLVTILLVSSFIGLWGHNFAPTHLYNPAVSPIDVGERNKDFMRIADFNRYVPIASFAKVWADDRNPLVFLLNPDDYSKIETMPASNIGKLGSHGNELAYVLKDLNLYFYYAGTFSPIDNPKDVGGVKDMLQQRLESRFNLVFNDGKYEVWETFSDPP